ncbi:MAG: response regulator, partial [Candidatus Krumholzibacteria bacterium]
MKITILIAEDDEGLRSSLEKSLKRRGHETLCASTVSEANRLLQKRKIDLMLLDLRLADGSGFDVLAKARDLDEEIAVIMMTAFPDVKIAVRAMKEGASDFIVKPFELEDLHLTLQRVIEARELRRQVRRLEHEQQRQGDFAEILGESPVIEQVRSQIRKVAVADSPVLVAGETGT